jgi:tetratricopeptide (TPR) repeat protein
MGQTPGAVDAQVIGLLEEAIETLPAAERDLAAYARARLAVELDYAPGARRRRDSLTREAVSIAQGLEDSAASGFALAAQHYVHGGPRNLQERLEAASAAAATADDPELAVNARGWLVVDRLEQGDIAGVEVEIAEHGRLARRLRQPFHLRWDRMFRSMLATFRGEFAEGERLAEAALDLGRRVHEENAYIGYVLQLWAIRRYQGRLAEIEPLAAASVERYPGLVAWRAGLALLHAELERTESARPEFERLVDEHLDELPEDLQWTITTTSLARTCALLRDPARAEPLYELLAPYADRNVVAGYGSACLGSCSRQLGLLAHTMSHIPEARRHFEDALEMNSSAGARPEVAEVQYECARTLLAAGRGATNRAVKLLDASYATARTLGMSALERRVRELRPLADR